jgi:hypothetical protein
MLCLLRYHFLLSLTQLYNMVSQVHTINDFTRKSAHPAADREQRPLPRQTLLSSHPNLLLRETSILQPVMIRPPTGITSFPTSQAQETIHRPEFSGPSTTTRVILAGLGSGVQAGTQAYAQASIMREQWKTMPRNMVRATEGMSPERENFGARPSEQADIDSQGDVILDQDSQVNVAMDSPTGASADFSSNSAPTSESVLQPKPMTQPKLAGIVEAQFEDVGFEMGSGATEIANPLNGTAIERDRGVELFNNGRRSNWLPLGSAVSD